jgi:hypothetical protein
VVKGNPAAEGFDLGGVELVFKKGVGYDSRKLHRLGRRHRRREVSAPGARRGAAV